MERIERRFQLKHNSSVLQPKIGLVNELNKQPKGLVKIIAKKVGVVSAEFKLAKSLKSKENAGDLSDRMSSLLKIANETMRKSGCKCGPEAKQNPHAAGCKSRWCVKREGDARLNNLRFLNAALKRGSQRFGMRSSRLSRSESPRQITTSNNSEQKAAA